MYSVSWYPFSKPLSVPRVCGNRIDGCWLPVAAIAAAERQTLRRQMFLYEAYMQLQEYLSARERSCQAALQGLDVLWNG